MSSLAERIKKKDRKPVPVEVASWGETVYLRALTVADRLSLNEFEGKRGSELIVKALVLSVTDELGVPVWTDPAEVAALDIEPVMQVWDAIKKLNHLTVSEAEIDAEKKDDTATTNGDSPAASPSPAAAG